MVSSPEFAYIIGIAIGDGNISNPNGRTYRLRITCDARYPKIISMVVSSLKKVFPKNKVSLIPKKKTAFDVSVYNKKINEILGWKLENGKKINQKILIPDWINSDKEFIKFFIKGLFESDGSIYYDRGYIMTNFVSYNKEVIDYLLLKIKAFDFEASLSKYKEKNGMRYTVRICKKSKEFIQYFNIEKS